MSKEEYNTVFGPTSRKAGKAGLLAGAMVHSACCSTWPVLTNLLWCFSGMLDAPFSTSRQLFCMLTATSPSTLLSGFSQPLNLQLYSLTWHKLSCARVSGKEQLFYAFILPCTTNESSMQSGRNILKRDEFVISIVNVLFWLCLKINIYRE